MKIYLTIDFEDFSHDFKRDLKIWETGPLREKSLWTSYIEIDQLLKHIGGKEGKKATFFCTGLIAERQPELIKKIAEDGHEIACHYHFHDEMLNQSLPTIERDLKRAIHFLEKASGQKILGFRAPKFKIDTKSNSQYQLIQDLFTYDSSLVVSHPKEAEQFKKRMGLDRLKIIPVYRDNFYGLNLKLGGTYLKLFPSILARKLIRNAQKKSFQTQIYIHPYELDPDKKYKVSFVDLKCLGSVRAIYWYFRQIQWLGIGNKSLKKKISNLISAAGFAGRLCDNIK